MRYLLITASLFILSACGQNVSQNGSCSFSATGGGINMQKANAPMTQESCALYCADTINNSTLQTTGEAPQWQCKFNNQIIDQGSF